MIIGIGSMRSEMTPIIVPSTKHTGRPNNIQIVFNIIVRKVLFMAFNLSKVINIRPITGPKRRGNGSKTGKNKINKTR